MSNEDELNEEEVLERLETVRQLKSSGVQFCIKFIGTAIVSTSMNGLPSSLQNDVAHCCMQLVARQAAAGGGASTPQSMSSPLLNGIEHIRPNSTVIVNQLIDMNITSQSLILISSEGGRPISRFNVKDISVVSPGRDDLSHLFCFIAKATEKSPYQQQQQQPAEVVRKCFVFDAGEEMKEVQGCIYFAFEIAFSEMPQPSATPGGSNATTPTIQVDRPLVEEPSHPHPQQLPPLPSSEPPELPPRTSTTSGGSGRCFTAFSPAPAPTTSSGGKDSLSPMSPLAPAGPIGGGDLNNEGVRTRSRSSSSRGEMAVEVSDERYLEITDRLWDAPWFHGLLSREEAISLLKSDGQFLVRQSPSIPRQFVLSGMNNREIRHMCLIGHGPHGRISSKQGEFKSIFALVDFFHSSGQPLTSNLASDQPQQVFLILKYPIERRD